MTNLQRERIMRGITQLGIAIPFMFAGPAIFVAKGQPGLEDGNWTWTAISVLGMFLGAALLIRGLSSILKGFFNDPE